MAVPFNMPEEQTEVDVIISQLQTLLNKLQVAVNRGNLDSSNATPVRVRHPSRSRDEGPSSQSQSQNPAIPDLVHTLSSWLAIASRDSAASTPLTAISRSPRRRTSSESSSCEETKISITAIVKHGSVQDWNQVEPDREKGVAPASTGLMSVLAPTSVSSCSLWTAMICFVGWHIFRAR